ncbi:26s proteasome non-atpase regulatory subunit 13 [Anaeramoeba flamelloides]|uniref:26s proteasome non-atpase regulatory subunit 13 n=1 Tax=Anaeramoeba flamelloides TaxID=1746091 RepID=A0ABQ8XNE0_9EUKA|nr:26s proteasome non-atpase regulatory subunit 13 [Anaeramoeba flamelloides]
MTYIEKLSQNVPELSGELLQLKTLSDRKLWHELSIIVEQLFDNPLFLNNELIPFYTNFLKQFENKIDPIKFALFAITISKQYPNLEEKILFLEQCLVTLKQNLEGRMLVRFEISRNKLITNDFEFVKELIETTQNIINEKGTSFFKTIVLSSFYNVCCLYYKNESVNSSLEFYQSGMLFLTFTDLEKMIKEEKIQLAFELGIAALSDPKIFSFGELVKHKILIHLKDTEHEWLYQLLIAYHSGDMERYQQVIEKYSSTIEKNSIFTDKKKLLKDKLITSCLIELIFKRPSNDRNVKFDEISKALNISIEDVEFVAMKAMSLGLLKGKIDQVNNILRVTWVITRVLTNEQIKIMKNRLGLWTEKVNEKILLLENETPDLFK